MVNNNKTEDIYSAWYNFSSEVGKHLFDLSNVENLNYGLLQESWQGYTEKMKDQMNKLMNLDENSYKDMLTLWNEFSENMSSQISKITIYDKANYTHWYENWLDYTDRINKDLSDVVQKQLQIQTEVFEANELWMNRFGFKEEHKQLILDISQILSEYWLEVINKSTEMASKSFNPESRLDFNFKFQEFYDYLTNTNSNLVKRLMNAYGFENWKGYEIDQNLIGFNMVQDFIKNNLKDFSTVKVNDHKKLSEEIESLKTEVDVLAKEMNNYKKSSTSRKKR